jgi:ribosomal protein S18 acetylase RimI-like enzyme
MLHIRTMQTADIPFAIRLSEQEDWGLTRNDLQRILRLNPLGSFVAYEGSKRLGITTTASYGKHVAWVGHVIVDKRHRGKHIGHRMVEHAVTYLEKTKIQYVALYFFNQHVKFYENLGFVKDRPFLRMKRKASNIRYMKSQSLNSRKLTFGQLLSADRRAFGADRSRLLRLLIAERNVSYISFRRNPDSRAYLIVKRFHNMSELGPWVCIKTTKDELRGMLTAALTKTARKPVEVSCLRNNSRALDLLKSHGFNTVMEGYRMYFEVSPNVGDDRAQYALGFLDKG